MEDKNFTARTAELVIKDFQIETAEEKTLTEQDLLDVLANQIAYFIEHRMDFLLSLMYRLDIPEAKVDFALSPEHPLPPNMALAKLVLDRQKQRVNTKIVYKQDEIDLEEGLEW